MTTPLDALPGDALGVVASFLGAADALAFAAVLGGAPGAPPASDALAARVAAIAAGVHVLASVGVDGDPLAGLAALHAARALPPGSESLGDALWELGAGGHLPPAAVGRAMTALILDALDVAPAVLLDAYFARALPVPLVGAPPPTPVAALRTVLTGCRLPGSSRATQCFLRRFARRYAGAVLRGALVGESAAAPGALPPAHATTTATYDGARGGGRSVAAAAATTSPLPPHAVAHGGLLPPLLPAAALSEEEAVYVLAFSLLVLNADMRAPHAVRPGDARMSPARYLAAVREIPDVDALPDAFLVGCYAELVAEGLPVGDGVPLGPVDVPVDDGGVPRFAAGGASGGGDGRAGMPAATGDGALAAAADAMRAALSAAAVKLRAWWHS
jgi:hypothetical protein